MEKISLARDRRVSEERAAEERISAEIDSKLQDADIKRQVQNTSKQDKVRSHNKKVQERVETVNFKMNKGNEIKKQELQEKLKKANERHE